MERRFASRQGMRVCRGRYRQVYMYRGHVGSQAAEAGPNAPTPLPAPPALDARFGDAPKAAARPPPAAMPNAERPRNQPAGNAERRTARRALRAETSDGWLVREKARRFDQRQGLASRRAHSILRWEIMRHQLRQGLASRRAHSILRWEIMRRQLRDHGQTRGLGARSPLCCSPASIHRNGRPPSCYPAALVKRNRSLIAYPSYLHPTASYLHPTRPISSMEGCTGGRTHLL